MTSMMRLQRRASSFVVGLLLAAAMTAAPSTDTLHYAVREEIAVGSAIADIVTDAGLHVYGVEVCVLEQYHVAQGHFTGFTLSPVSTSRVDGPC